jgi:putative ABC transport system permease protein
MNALDLKIALRTFQKGKWYSILNIAGLALGLAAFILVTLYVDNENSYERWNKNADRVYLVGREMSNGPSPYTPGKLAEAIKRECPEIEEAGRTNTALFQLPFFTPSGRFLIKNWVGADYSIARILGIKPKGFNLNPQSIQPTVLISSKTAKVLFPHNTSAQNKTINMASKSGMPVTIAGVAQDPPGNTNFTFDCIGFSNDITQGKDQSYATQIYRTYILVRPDADITLLTKKIDRIYKREALSDTSKVSKEALAYSEKPSIYLDALTNLHLKPHYGSQVNNQIVKGLSALAIIILFVTAINFTNLYLSQANRRAKEVGVKKVNGIMKRQIALQFLSEIFLQCVAALAISFVAVTVALPYFNNLLQVHLWLSGIHARLILQLLTTLIILTLLAGIYPSVVMAGFKPANVLRGDPLTNGQRFHWLRNAITVAQFAFAIGFIIMLMVINQQVEFMKNESPGFTARQVLYIDNLSLFNTPGKFEPVRDRIEAIPGVKKVTVASNIPGGLVPATHEYTALNRSYAMNTIAVDYGYFEALNIQLKEGRVFTPAFRSDSAGVIINETAAKLMNLKAPIGATIDGCGGTYTVIGVIKDFKAYGFEENTQPSVYLMSAGCGVSKTQIMIQVDNEAIASVVHTLNNEWSDINRLDADNFNYHFLDKLYGQLFVKQEQLRMVLLCFSVLAVIIAGLGLFSQAAHTIRLRIKEVAIRKTFGAGAQQLILTLSKPFFYNSLLANLIAWPVALVFANKWLETFAYRTHISVVPFLSAIGISIVVVLLAVCLQTIRAVRVNPAAKLKV